jgi:hypothetical protein
VPLTLTIPAGAAPGPYMSYADAGTAPAAASGPGAAAALGAGGMTALVFTVSPSVTPPPPCTALDLAQSTGEFPGWPTAAFATTSWRQEFADDGTPEGSARPDPSASPAAAPAVRFTPVAATSRPIPKKLLFDVLSWACIGVILLAAIRGLAKLLRIT